MAMLMICLLYTSYNKYMKQVDFSSMTKEELESYALDTSRKLDEVSAELEYYKEPVSYTHLDVYKRQPIRFDTS